MAVDYSKINEPKYRPKFLSEYSMGQLDFIRYNEWLKYVETWSAEINSTTEPTLEMIQHLFSGLVNLYDNWRPIIAIKTETKKLDEMVNDAKKKKRIWENNQKTNISTPLKIKREIIDILGNMKTKLMEIKQIIGLGIILKKNIGTREKIDMGMNLSGNAFNRFPDLPEA